MTTTTRVHVVDAVADDRPQATATLLTAFAADPLMRWMFPDADQYLTWFPQILRHYGGSAFDLGTVHRTTDFAGVAAWLPAGVSPDEEALGAVVHEGVAPGLLEEVFTLLERVGASHPNEPHWFLPGIGVDPRSQGQGIGGALLAHGLATVDEQHAVAYLESSNPRNIRLYERHGFTVIRQIQLGSAPPVTPMVRTAR
jgi:ribosomal protein S18 acetylase RimI-like enzyme